MMRSLRSTFSIGLLILLSLFMFSCSSSRKTLVVEEGWELLGQTKVNFIRDRDEINVSSTQSFSALRFRVEDRDIRVNEVKIYFQNGDKLEPNVDEIIGADSYSREIELATDGRYISKIEFKFRTTGNLLKGRANVLVFGRRYPGW